MVYIIDISNVRRGCVRHKLHRVRMGQPIAYETYVVNPDMGIEPRTDQTLPTQSMNELSCVSKPANEKGREEGVKVL